MVYTVVGAQTREAHSARTVCYQYSRTIHAGRIAPHVEQPCMESIALYAVQPRFSVAREACRSHPPSPHRERQPYRRDDDVGPQCMVESSSSIGPTGGNGGVARGDRSHVQIAICAVGEIYLRII